MEQILSIGSIWNNIRDLLASYKMPQIEPVGDSKVSLSSVKWKNFEIEEIFEGKTENFISRSKEAKGSIPYVSSFATNNGVKNFLDVDPS